MKGRIECNMPQHSKSTPHQCPRQQLCFKPALTDICINAPKCLLALLPLIFDRRFTVSVSRDPPSLFSLIAQLAFHGPLWQLQTLRKAEVIPPLLLQPCIEEEVWGRDSMQQNVNARSGLSHGNQVWDPGIFCARMRDDGGLYFFFFFAPPFLEDYIWTKELWLSLALWVPDLSSRLISPSPPSPTLLCHPLSSRPISHYGLILAFMS